MLNWLFLSFITLYVAVVLTVAAYDKGYMKCTEESRHQPGICDCRENNDCFIKFTITRRGDNEENFQYYINNERMGPTIIVNYETIVVVDVFNLNPDAVSIHWHGMHQHRAQFMDGVGNITQVAIKYSKTFRYVFSATPTGTHWYHSHMGDQRDKGLLGALIVLEKERPVEFPKVRDLPKEHTIAIQDSLTEVENPKEIECEPDGSVAPGSNLEIKSWVINGKELSNKIANPDCDRLEPLFHVEPGEQYRFRIIGAMKAAVLRMSIDKHELDVISSDGYLTKLYSTDLLIIHVGERYDVIPRSKNGTTFNGQVFPIRIESVAVHCDDFSKPERVGYAYLKYCENGGEPENPKVIRDDNRCRDGDHCVALNCPFQKYPNEIHQTDIDCKPVSELKLFHPTSATDLPENENVEEYFFNFDFPSVEGSKAMVNGVQFVLPSKFPFVNPERKVPNEKCHYKCIDRKFTDPQIYLCKTCSHTVRVPSKEINSTSDEFKPKTIRFVFSSLPSKSETKDVTDVRTHPIHLHGHSFFVRKIAYPTYNENNQTIKNVNQDLERTNCGPLSWKEKGEFGLLSNTTMRKDVIIVPAGGYVVIEFLADNPGWWFLHCHIDFHLIRGMAIAVNELPECQNDPPSHDKEFNPDDSYHKAVQTFNGYQNKDKCNIKASLQYVENLQHFSEQLTPTPTPTESTEDAIAREANFHNMRQKFFNPVVNMNLDNQFTSPHYKQLFHQRFRTHAADPEQRRFQDFRERNEHAPEWNK